MTAKRPVALPGFLPEPAWDRLVRALGLSGREAEIVALILGGMNEAAMGDELGISPHTVHTYLERLHRKLDVSGRCQLVVRLFEEYVAQEPANGRTVAQALRSPPLERSHARDAPRARRRSP